MTQPATESNVPAGEPASSRDFYVVGLGASAGGLGALRTLFSHMPEDPGVAVVVVVHLSPSHESLLAPLLQPYSPMPVEQVQGTVRLERNHVYVIPPNANITAIDTHLRLTELEHHRLERAPIDHFMRTLAATHDGKSVGVVLTGAGSDGSLGLRQIKEHGGLTIAQDPYEAEYDSMPQSAIATGMVDRVLPLRDMAGEIVRFCSTTPLIGANGSATRPTDGDQDVLNRILAIVRGRTGRDLSMYSPETTLRHVRRRMQLRHVRDLEAYLGIVGEHPDEAVALQSDMLLSVTEFFRDGKLFDALASATLPELFGRLQDNRFRAWSIGCSTGEEAYSLAMLSLEEAERRGVSPELRVFASDFSDDMLKRAREGVYPQEIAAMVTPRRLSRFFQMESGHFRIRPELRGVVVFASHDLFKDPPYQHLDLIVSRNLLADLQPEIRRAVLNVFHYALRPEGALVVGDRDRLDDADLFELASAPGIYRRRPGPSRVLDMPASGTVQRALPPVARASWASTETLVGVHRKALLPYTPPSLLVDDKDEIVHYAPGVAPYLQIPGGMLRHNVVRLVRAPLRSVLVAALAAVRRSGAPHVSPAVTVGTELGARRLRLRVDPVTDSAYDRDLVLVVFDELVDRDAASSSESRPAETIAALETELAATNERLHSIMQSKPHDAADGSGGESPRREAELADIFEELQSSKEELEAVNEELTSIDVENRNHLADLRQLSGDLENLLQSTGMATIFLDAQQQIVRFTLEAAGLFQIRPEDVGRRLADMSTSLVYGTLDADSQRVLATGKGIEREVPARDGRWFVLRMSPYLTLDSVQGIVLTLLDVTVRKRAELALRDVDRRKDEFLAVLAHELRNPLAPISAGVEVLKRSGADQRTVAKVAAMMERQTRQLVRLVDDLLDAARIAGGRVQLRPSQVELSIVARDAVAAVEPLIERSKHRLEVRMDDEPLLVQADGARLTQVIANTLTNAANYTPPEGHIELVVTREGGSAVVRVRDDGHGMSPDVLANLFDMYFQGPTSGPTRSKGLGIGMAIAKQLVEMQGGSITASSEGPGLGSTFVISFPLLDGVSASAADAPSPHASVVARRVLVVDDNVDAAQSLSMLLLTIDGIKVRTALSGPDAIEAGPSFRPHVVLLDLGMPGMDGYEVARLIRQEPWGRRVLLVAVTGWGQIEHRLRASAAGFDQHVTKPVVRDTLEDLLTASEERDRASAE